MWQAFVGFPGALWSFWVASHPEFAITLVGLHYLTTLFVLTTATIFFKVVLLPTCVFLAQSGYKFFGIDISTATTRTSRHVLLSANLLLAILRFEYFLALQVTCYILTHLLHAAKLRLLLAHLKPLFLA